MPRRLEPADPSVVSLPAHALLANRYRTTRKRLRARQRRARSAAAQILAADGLTGWLFATNNQGTYQAAYLLAQLRASGTLGCPAVCASTP